MDPWTAMLIAVGVVVVLAIAGARNPLTKCWRCDGRGVLRSWLLPWRFRSCPRCGRRGELGGRSGKNT